MVSVEQARESLKQAVDSLAIGPGRVRERLEHAALFIPTSNPTMFPTGTYGAIGSWIFYVFVLLSQMRSTTR